MMVKVIFVLCLSYLNIAKSFISPKVTARSSIPVYSQPGSYENLLRQARERHGKASPFRKQSPPPAAAAPATKTSPTQQSNPVKVQTPTPVKTIKKNKNGLPFDDAMYDNIKIVVEKITRRLRSENALTMEEFISFEKAVLAIIEDSEAVMTPKIEAAFKKTNKPLETTSDPSNTSITTTTNENGSNANADNNEISTKAFDLFKGVGSTWIVPNMEKMSTEEYYAALNKRMAGVRQKLAQEGLLRTGKGEDYTETLNKRSKK